MKSHFPFLHVLLALALVIAAIFFVLRSGTDARNDAKSSAIASEELSPKGADGHSVAPRSDRAPSDKRRRNPDLPGFVFEIDKVAEESSELGELNTNFDPVKLKELLANPPKRRSSQLADLICLAAAEKDTSFRHILKQANLRPRFDLELDAYDYAVNDNEEALDRVLEKHASEAPGSDSSTVVVLSYLDEWERTIPAVLKHFEDGSDGAGTTCRLSFWRRRKAHFPGNFERLLHPK